ncbi:MAG: DNA repair protein RecN [Gemmatimonadales bacterium]|nr:MAG: DNA repair protein RecN [Gemmatimonadales bacterium]
MLLELRIRDFAVIQDLSLELGPGLNVLTGETGAGKSIIVGALSLLLGDRASNESVRTGAERARVEAVFDLSGRAELHALLDDQGLPDEGELLLLRREVQAEGRNRAWINGSPATAGAVGAFGRALVDLHGQHEHQTLLDPVEQRRILDAFANGEAMVEEIGRLHARLALLLAERESRVHRGRELASRADFLRFQLQEIQEAELRPGEDREVEEDLLRLDHVEELAREAEAVHEALYGGEGAVSEVLAEARDRIRRLARLDADLGELERQLDSLYHQAVDAGRRAGEYAGKVEVDPSRAEALRARLDRVFRLKRKYGPELQDVLDTARRLADELEELDTSSLALEALDREAGELRGRLEERAGELSVLRAEAASRLSGEVGELLPELGMKGSRFQVSLDPLPEPGAHGGERVEFQASLNPGFPPRALARIASGGELSRVMLALKAILVRMDRVPTLIFDEVDAGIGGAVAVAVGQKLQEVAAHHQVVVITHLPQVASRAGRHLRVEKGEDQGVATTRLVTLEGDERVGEIARMLGGDPESRASQEHARELLASR